MSVLGLPQCSMSVPSDRGEAQFIGRTGWGKCNFYDNGRARHGRCNGIRRNDYACRKRCFFVVFVSSKTNSYRYFFLGDDSHVSVILTLHGALP